MATGEIERAEDIGTDSEALARRWCRELDLAGQHEEKWRKRARKVVERYRDEDRGRNSEATEDRVRFNILYANTEVLSGVIYARVPIPDVRRRFLDRDPAGKQAAQLLQRALSYTMDAYDFDAVARSCVSDYLLPGRAVAKVAYKPTLDPTGQEVVYEEVTCEHVDWDMFRMSPAKSWERVRWVAFGELLTRADLEAQFGPKGKMCRLDWAPPGKEDESDDLFRRALVWSIWNKADRKVYVVSKGYDSGPLAEVDDPLGLEGFFPCPQPLMSISTTDTMVPVPEYLMYQDQAIELDDITERITKLVDALRRRGVYDATYPEIAKLANAGDNEFVAVENFSNLAEKGGIAAALYEQPIDMIAKVLVELYRQREQIKQTIYEVMGIADIVRGSTSAIETLGAQELKARYANVRTGPRQMGLQKFLRDILRIKAEIISEKFAPQTLALMTGTMPDEQVLQILRNDKLRGFRVDVETDSTIQPDADTEQKNRVEMLRAVVEFMTGIGPMVQAGVIPIEIARELLLFGLRSFKTSPQIEDSLEAIGSGDDPQAQVQKMMQAQMQQLQQQYAERTQKLEQGEQALKDESTKISLERQSLDFDTQLADMKKALDAKIAAYDQAIRDVNFEGEKQDVIREVAGKMDEARTGIAETVEKAREEDGSERLSQVESILERMATLHQEGAERLDGLQAAVEQLTRVASAPRKLSRLPTGEKVAVPVLQ